MRSGLCALSGSYPDKNRSCVFCTRSYDVGPLFTTWRAAEYFIDSSGRELIFLKDSFTEALIPASVVDVIGRHNGLPRPGGWPHPIEQSILWTTTQPRRFNLILSVWIGLLADSRPQAECRKASPILCYGTWLALVPAVQGQTHSEKQFRTYIHWRKRKKNY